MSLFKVLCNLLLLLVRHIAFDLHFCCANYYSRWQLRTFLTNLVPIVRALSCRRDLLGNLTFHVILFFLLNLLIVCLVSLELELSPFALWIFDDSGRLVDWSSRAWKMAKRTVRIHSFRSVDHKKFPVIFTEWALVNIITVRVRSTFATYQSCPDFGDSFEGHLVKVLLHCHIAFLNVTEKLLSVRPCLCTGSSAYVLFNLLPVLAVKLESLQKSKVLC